MIPFSEIKRKAFHFLSLGYIVLYAVMPRWGALWVFGLMVVGVGLIEFLRLRRPELNAYLLNRFGHINREEEIMSYTGIFWGLAGCWATMLIFTNPKIVMAAMGFLTFGDAAAALGGKKWGKHVWPQFPPKTYEGSASFAVASTLWGSFFVKPWVALPAACLTAYFEARGLSLNDNFWIPIVSAASLSVLNLLIGRY